jgi:thiosulfate dehydrogenase [quinone] large subunit
MAGAASSNGLLLVTAVLLILAWKVAGYIGADFFLPRWLGTPWGRSQTEAGGGLTRSDSPLPAPGLGG